MRSEGPTRFPVFSLPDVIFFTLFVKDPNGPLLWGLKRPQPSFLFVITIQNPPPQRRPPPPPHPPPGGFCHALFLPDLYTACDTRSNLTDNLPTPIRENRQCRLRYEVSCPFFSCTHMALMIALWHLCSFRRRPNLRPNHPVRSFSLLLFRIFSPP